MKNTLVNAVETLVFVISLPLLLPIVIGTYIALQIEDSGTPFADSCAEFDKESKR